MQARHAWHIHRFLHSGIPVRDESCKFDVRCLLEDVQKPFSCLAHHHAGPRAPVRNAPIRPVEPSRPISPMPPFPELQQAPPSNTALHLQDAPNPSVAPIPGTFLQAQSIYDSPQGFMRSGQPPLSPIIEPSVTPSITSSPDAVPFS